MRLRARMHVNTLKLRPTNDAIRKERKLCVDIVMVTRMREIETGLRSVISFIERRDTAEELKKQPRM